ncbi:hypothetical protein MJO28_004322 [Puccinia striiformis f. sp. tritici]|uniref:Uncharacterized protein n=4 Tax=Puccinia striiformis TaxID=27350 RepID=A0A0L0VFB7_9BASI|nr:hypothetical protein Pst134EA_007091 [Puccinia striiformis f. sp. tritici]KAI9616303.1 hypothetical protein KEM48_005217 [Puccinia striiformis f. sp. tritici PST-130]KNE97709.1 hypothetical protein PSTG_08930 [Puccinia striiformis f. sp. tritici PST-78]POV98599.1 hypothetical protein PSTT_14291 [Puccinia striiformis]KAH9460022.1 hypothetical protein Pst134EB_008229 [Puccinia striiformis f. sp. tritici]KAH9469814.1 hypothetical protein Pst134EA_007091 [Puccinia striiformis f. sp. tritici]
MVARMRTSRASVTSTAILTPFLIRKSKKSAPHKSKRATNAIGLDGQSFALGGTHPPAPHVMPKQSRFPTSLLSVPAKKSTRPRALHSTSGSGRGRESSGHGNAAGGSSRGVYLNARLNEPSAKGHGTSSSLVPNWHSAASGRSLEGRYLGSTNVSFYSAQELLEGGTNSPTEAIASKDFIISPGHHSADHQPSPRAKSSPQNPDVTDQSDSCEQLTSSGNVSTDESFRCRGLSSSQITPNSLSQPSVGLNASIGGGSTSYNEPSSSANLSTDESFERGGLSSSQIANARSQPSDEKHSQPSDEEPPQYTGKRSPPSSDRDSPQPTKQELSERRDPNSLRMKTTESHCIIDCCDEIIRNKTRPESHSDHHSSEEERPGGDPTLEVTRKHLPNCKDEVAVGMTNGSHSAFSDFSSAPDPVRANIPAGIGPKDNRSVFKCSFLRKLIKALGSHLIVLNERRKKLKSELQDKIRCKFQRGSGKRSQVIPPR